MAPFPNPAYHPFPNQDMLQIQHLMQPAVPGAHLQAPPRLPFSNTNTATGHAGNINITPHGRAQTQPTGNEPTIEELLGSSSEEEAPVTQKKAPAPRKRGSYKKKKSVKRKLADELLDSGDSDAEEEEEVEESRAKKGSKKKKSKGGSEPNKSYYKQGKITMLLDLIEEHKPNGGNSTWLIIQHRFNEGKPESEHRQVASLRNKFKSLFKQLPPTGDPNCPPNVKRAKRLKDAIMYGNGATTAVEGTAIGTERTGSGLEEGGRPFVSRRHENASNAMTLQDLMVLQAEQVNRRAAAEAERAAKDRRAAAEAERAAKDRRWELEQRLEREKAADKRMADERRYQSERYQVHRDMAGVVANAFGHIIGPNFGADLVPATSIRG
jgi:hypothetical protein